MNANISNLTLADLVGALGRYSGHVEVFEAENVVNLCKVEVF